jgi:hypothetical protein
LFSNFDFDDDELYDECVFSPSEMLSPEISSSNGSFTRGGGSGDGDDDDGDEEEDEDDSDDEEDELMAALLDDDFYFDDGNIALEDVYGELSNFSPFLPPSHFHFPPFVVFFPRGLFFSFFFFLLRHFPFYPFLLGV